MSIILSKYFGAASVTGDSIVDRGHFDAAPHQADAILQQHFRKMLRYKQIWSTLLLKASVKGTGTRDLIWIKVVSLDRSWLVGLTDDL